MCVSAIWLRKSIIRCGEHVTNDLMICQWNAGRRYLGVQVMRCYKKVLTVVSICVALKGRLKTTSEKFIIRIEKTMR